MTLDENELMYKVRLVHLRRLAVALGISPALHRRRLVLRIMSTVERLRASDAEIYRAERNRRAVTAAARR